MLHELFSNVRQWYKYPGPPRDNGFLSLTLQVSVPHSPTWPHRALYSTTRPTLPRRPGLLICGALGRLHTAILQTNADATVFCRFILNYKRLPYRTVWVEFHDVERVLRSINAPPTATARDGRPIFTLPALVDPSRSPHNPVILTNPNMIAEYLEV